MWQDEFYRLLQSDDIGEFERAYSLKDANLPEFLCKYRVPTEASLRNVRDDTVWLSPASRFNDPFDTSLSVDAGPALTELLRRSYVTNPLPSLNDAQMQEIASSRNPVGKSSEFLAKGGHLTAGEAENLKAMESNSPVTIARDLAAQATKMLQGAVKVCCFSTQPLSMGMWSHYAQQHEGFCVLYSSSTLPLRERRNLFPVAYSSRRFSLTDLLVRLAETGQPPDPNSLIAMRLPLLAAIHKSPDWSYEKEWRLVFTDGGQPSGMAISMPSPTAILLGSRMERDYRDQVLAVARLKEICCHDVVLSHSTFELQTLRVNT